MPNPRPRVLVAAKTAEISIFGDLFQQADFDVVGRVSNGEDLVSAAHTLQPSVIICSISALGGLEQLSHLIAKCGYIPFVLVGADLHVTGVPNYRSVVAYVNKADIALEYKTNQTPVSDRNLRRRRHREFVSEGGCCFELLRPLRPNALIVIRLTDDRSFLSAADRDQVFKVAWIEQSEHGWAIGAVTLEDKTPWAMMQFEGNAKAFICSTRHFWITTFASLSE